MSYNDRDIPEDILAQLEDMISDIQSLTSDIDCFGCALSVADLSSLKTAHHRELEN